MEMTSAKTPPGPKETSSLARGTETPGPTSTVTELSHVPTTLPPCWFWFWACVVCMLPSVATIVASATVADKVIIVRFIVCFSFLLPGDLHLSFGLLFPPISAPWPVHLGHWRPTFRVRCGNCLCIIGCHLSTDGKTPKPYRPGVTGVMESRRDNI